MTNPALEFFGCRREHCALQAALSARMLDVLVSGQMLQGPEVAAFEAELASAAGRACAVAVGSGTDALFFALVALGIGPGDDVLVPDLSFFASASAVLRTGARPVLVDIDGSCNLDLDKAAERITSRTRAMVFVHLFGGMSDPDAIERFARSHGIDVVEDAAQAYGARHGARRAGGTGVVAAFSFDPTKVIAAPGSGGAVLTDDPAIAARIRRLRYHGKAGGDYVELGYNSQMTSLTAAVLTLKLRHHEAWTARRRAIADHYRECLAPFGVAFPHWSEAVGHVWHKFTLQVPGRDALRTALAAAGVPTMVHYATPFHRERLVGLGQGGDGDFPVATRVSAETVSLPLHAHLSDAEVEHVAAALRATFAGTGLRGRA